MNGYQAKFSVDRIHLSQKPVLHTVHTLLDATLAGAGKLMNFRKGNFPSPGTQEQGCPDPTQRRKVAKKELIKLRVFATWR